jgi:hypothetical protein
VRSEIRYKKKCKDSVDSLQAGTVPSKLIIHFDFSLLLLSFLNMKITFATIFVALTLSFQAYAYLDVEDGALNVRHFHMIERGESGEIGMLLRQIPFVLD